MPRLHFFITQRGRKRGEERRGGEKDKRVMCTYCFKQPDKRQKHDEARQTVPAPTLRASNERPKMFFSVWRQLK